MPAVIQPGGSRTESRFAKAARFDEPDDVMPMSGPLRQQFEHAVVIDRFADQRPADQSRKVIIADADRVRVAVGALHRLGGGPDPDTRHRAQGRGDGGAAASGMHRSLESVGNPGCGNDRCGPTRVDAGQMSFPGRYPAPLPGRRAHP